MPVLLSEVQFRLSGGSGNTNPNTSIGGIISSFQILDGVVNSMFDDITDAQALAGDTNYRLFYLYNASATATFQGSNIWMNVLPGGDATMTIALAAGGLNTTPTALANEATAPAGVTFVAAISEGTAIFTGDIPPLGRYGFWVKRVQSSSATPPAVTPPFSLIVKGLTNT